MGIARAGSGMPVGAVMHYPANSIPAGWLKANGAVVSRATYAALFAVVGTTYGAGDGSTTFGLPDLRGEFLRGLDDGRGVDAGRTIGTAQVDQNKAHKHDTESNGPAVIGNAARGDIAAGGTTVVVVGNNPMKLEGGNEARPRNVALLACIKF